MLLLTYYWKGRECLLWNKIKTNTVGTRSAEFTLVDYPTMDD